MSSEHSAPSIAVWRSSSARWNSFTRSWMKRPAGEHHQRPQEAGEQHQRHRQAVDADVVADARSRRSSGARYSSWNSGAASDRSGSRAQHRQPEVRRACARKVDAADLPLLVLRAAARPAPRRPAGWKMTRLSEPGVERSSLEHPGQHARRCRPAAPRHHRGVALRVAGLHVAEQRADPRVTQAVPRTATVSMRHRVDHPVEEKSRATSPGRMIRKSYSSST